MPRSGADRWRGCGTLDVLAILLAASLPVAACGDGGAAPSPRASVSQAAGQASPGAAIADAAPAGRATLVAKPPEMADGAMLMRSWASKLEAEQHATGRRRRALVYVGASWCEPCRHFHDAVARGELDPALPDVVLVEFDRDRDEATLREMGCISKMIPLVAVPDADGRCSDRRLEGAIKGPGAVTWMTPKIQALLD